MYGRGRGTPNHNDRRTSGGNTQVKDFRSTPQVGQKDHPLFGSPQNRDRTPNRQPPNRHGGKPDNSPRQRKDEPPKDDLTKGVPGNKGGRARSRSPVNRSAPPPKETPSVETASANNDEVVAPEGAESVKVDDNKSYKYTGRPGEKKFNGRCRLFVANLHNTTTEDDLKELFGEFGETGEIYVNKEKGFGFIRLDYRHNAEMAKLTLDKRLHKGRNIQVRYATHASAIELHGLDNFASNDFIEKAMSTFGAVERCVVVCDDRGRSKGYAIVEFEWKKSAAKVLDRLKDEMFVLGRLPKPVFAKPYILTDEEEGVHEEALERLDGLEQEREHPPRFISPNSFEYTWAKRWRDLFIEEQDKKARLEQEMTDARCKLEFEMEAAIRQQEASRIREELARRQEELRMLEEDMMRRQEADMRILERSRQRELAARQGRPEPPPQDERELHNNELQLSRENAARQQDFAYLRQKAEMTLQQVPDNIGNLGLDMMGPSGFGRGQQQQGVYQGGYQGGQQGPRQMQMDYRNQQRGPPRDMQPQDMRQQEMRQREMQHRELQHREMQQREMGGRDMPPRDGPPRDLPPRGLPPRDVPTRDLPKDKPPAAAEEKTAESPAAKPAVEVDPSKRPPRR